MRKTPIAPAHSEQRSPLDIWRPLDEIATAELSSEDPVHPFEAALRGDTVGWKAAAPGPQTIRLKFDKPTAIRRIRLEFREHRMPRSQEFRLSAITATGQKREIVRQQWNFSPAGSTTEVEDYAVQLHDVSVLELEIDPDRGNPHAVASLHSIALA